MNRQDEVDEILGTFVSEQCWSVIGGIGADHTIALDMGEKRRRSLRLANPSMSFLQRTYEGSHSLLIECPWRIDGPKRTAASALDMALDEKVGFRAFDQLAQRQVVAIESRGPAFDLVVTFEDDWVLKAFADVVDATAGRNNWQCWTPSGLITVGPRSEVSFSTVAEAADAFKRLRLAPFEGLDDDVEDE